MPKGKTEAMKNLKHFVIKIFNGYNYRTIVMNLPQVLRFYVQ